MQLFSRNSRREPHIYDLADDDVSGMAIEVETTNKTVHLIGNVSSTAALAEAVRIAEGTDGVTRVDATRLIVRTDLTTNR